MRLPLAAVLEGRLLRRYRRFLAEIELPGGGREVVHCPDPGSMRGCLRIGARVRCSESANPRRRLRYTLEMIRVGGTWVGVHTGRANQLVRRALAAGAIPGLEGYAEVCPEVRVGEGRLDFLLQGHPRDPRPAFLEVKSVTLAEGGLGLFPDSVTVRGRRHLETLARRARAGDRAVVLFAVQRGDCRAVAPAAEIDPAFAAALRRAREAGVEARAVSVKVRPAGLELAGPLPVCG